MAILPYLQQTWQHLHKTMQSNSFLLFLLSLSFLLLLYKILKAQNLNLPPSPPKLPIIGHLHQLGKLPHRSLQALSKKYGPLMLLHLGHTPTLVVSSADMAREMIKNHDIVFSNRPKTTAANIFSKGCVDVAFAPYGEYWRQAKKVSVLELLSLKRVQAFQYVREEEVALSIDKIRSACNSGASVNLSEMLISVSNNIISRCFLGRKAEEEGGRSKFGELSRTMMVLLTTFSFGDMFSYLGWIDHLTGLIAQLKATSRELDALLDQVLQEHRILESDDDQLAPKSDFVNVLLQLQKKGNFEVQITEDNLKAILLDMFVGGTDTTSTTMEWLMAELVRNQNIMRKAQEKVRRILGKKSKVEADDIHQMNYFKCIIKETLRLHPPAPLSVPRETSAAVELAGYYIPRRTTVLINAFSIQRDPSVWNRPEEFLPEEFLPERFLNNPVDFKGQDFQFIPFGGGRRGCPGITFGITSVEFVIANLLYWFDWMLPNGAAGKDLDMREAYGQTVCKEIRLSCSNITLCLITSSDHAFVYKPACFWFLSFLILWLFRCELYFCSCSFSAGFVESVF